jgi:hypothetical protein
MSTDTPTDDATAQAVALGLDPRGYPVQLTDLDYDDACEGAPTEVYVGWGDPASALPGEDGDEETGGDPDYTVLDFFSDQAGAEGVDLVEYLEHRGIGSEADADESLFADD